MLVYMSHRMLSTRINDECTFVIEFKWAKLSISSRNELFGTPSRNGVTRYKIEYRTKVNQHPWAPNETRYGQRPPRGAAASIILGLLAPSKSRLFLECPGWLAQPWSPLRAVATEIQWSSFWKNSWSGRCSYSLGGKEGPETEFTTALCDIWAPRVVYCMLGAVEPRTAASLGNNRSVKQSTTRLEFAWLPSVSWNTPRRVGWTPQFNKTKSKISLKIILVDSRCLIEMEMSCWLFSFRPIRCKSKLTEKNEPNSTKKLC